MEQFSEMTIIWARKGDWSVRTVRGNEAISKGPCGHAKVIDGTIDFFTVDCTRCTTDINYHRLLYYGLHTVHYRHQLP